MNAFPTMQYTKGISPSGFSPGMTLRDYFAAKAMQGLIIINDPVPTGEWPTYAGRKAYLIADAMMKARENNG